MGIISLELCTLDIPGQNATNRSGVWGAAGLVLNIILSQVVSFTGRVGLLKQDGRDDVVGVTR